MMLWPLNLSGHLDPFRFFRSLAHRMAQPTCSVVEGSEFSILGFRVPRFRVQSFRF